MGVASFKANSLWLLSSPKVLLIQSKQNLVCLLAFMLGKGVASCRQDTIPPACGVHPWGTSLGSCLGLLHCCICPTRKQVSAGSGRKSRIGVGRMGSSPKTHREELEDTLCMSFPGSFSSFLCPARGPEWSRAPGRRPMPFLAWQLGTHSGLRTHGPE